MWSPWAKCVAYVYNGLLYVYECCGAGSLITNNRLQDPENYTVVEFCAPNTKDFNGPYPHPATAAALTLTHPHNPAYLALQNCCYVFTSLFSLFVCDFRCRSCFLPCSLSISIPSCGF